MLHPSGQYRSDGHDSRIRAVIQGRLVLERMNTLSEDKVNQLITLVFEIAAQLPPSSSAVDDIELLPELMNVFLLDRHCLQDLLSIRMICTTTRRRAFPVPSHRHVELPPGLVESYLGGEYASYIPLQYISQALAILNSSDSSNDSSSDSSSDIFSDSDY